MSGSFPALQNRRRALLLIGICVLLYFIWAGLNRPLNLPDKPPASGPEAVTETAPEDARPPEPDIADYAVVVERPLFFAERTPYVAGEPDTPLTQPQPQTAPGLDIPFTLSAIVISAGKRLAVIHYGRDNKQQRIALGQSIDGWTFTAIERRSVLLKKGNATKNLELAIKTSGHAAPPMAGDQRSVNGPAR